MLERRSLIDIGFSQYEIREDGIVFTAEGKALTGSTNGQINMLNDDGERQAVMLSWVMAKAFRVPNPNQYKYLKHLDGDRKNIHYTNLEWSKHRSRSAGKKDDILVAVTQGMSMTQIAEELGVSEPYIRKVVKERYEELKNKKV